MRVETASTNVVYYLHGDHLGSTSLTTDTGGNRVGELRYLPYGGTRYEWGATPTDRRFTGQRSEEAALGSLYDYGARFYSPALGRFISADTIVPSPGNPQSLNRYAYTLNNPVKYTDPTGHAFDCGGGVGCGEEGHVDWQDKTTDETWANYFERTGQNKLSDWDTVVAATAPIWAPALALGGEEELGELWFIASNGIKSLIALLTGGAAAATQEVSTNGEGIAVVKGYAPPTGSRLPHFTVEVTHGGEALETEQVITSLDFSTTTIERVTAPEPPSQSMTVSLPNASAAQNYQRSVIDTELGAYGLSNSCVTHVCNVLRAGEANGVPNPGSGTRDLRFIQQILGFWNLFQK